ncbi:MAG: hypothetical protein FWH40_01855 [Coriobacteriia bacterium]|nr:hypothetical protein [Coriobacteriia bacterium]
MASKTLFAIYLPATQANFEVWVPNELTVRDAMQLINTVIADREGRWFKPGLYTSIYDKATGNELDINRLISDYSFVNGSQLVVI